MASAPDNNGDISTVVQDRSWLQRVGQSFAGALFGVLLVVGSCVLIFWNEGSAVTTARSLTEGAGLVRSVASDRIDPANDGKLVHVAGPLTASGPALDPEFALKIAAVRLVRRVEMYQWTEEQESESSKRLGGGETTKTTYKYKRSWVDHPVDSSRFHDRQGHGNPQMTWHGREIVAPDVKLGAFAVPDSMLAHFGSERPLAAGEEHVQAAQKRTDRPVQVIDGVLFIGRDPGQPSVGDYRISYGEVPRQPASIVARQAGAGLQPYLTQAGGTVALIAAGEVPAAAMFQEAQDDNRNFTWLLRAGGALAMFIGFALIMGPIGVIADVVPLLGDVVRMGTGFVALTLTLVLAPVVIAISWFWYRPLVALMVLAAGLALAYGAVHLARARKAASPSTATAAR
jgi:hypothetical protein